MQRVVKALAVAVAVACLATGLVPPAHAAKRDRPTAVYVSTSGIPHADVGDYRQSPFWRPGMPAGISKAWSRAIHRVLARIAAEEPDAVFHTGDMVEGRWGVDRRGTGVFGPVDTPAQRRDAIRLAGDLYYSQMKARWAVHGLYPHFAVGDHEVGDIGSAGTVDPSTLRHRALQTWRSTWARHFTDNGTRYNLHPAEGQHRDTAYAARLGDVGLITLDPIDWTPSGTHVRVTRRQLRWMRSVVGDLRARGARWIVVQCEIPALGPNRQFRSSGLTLENGSALWQTLTDLEVDLLLSAEFHAMTARSNGGRTPVQVVHGGMLHKATANYLVIKTFRNRIELQLKSMTGTTGRDEIWAPSLHRAPQPVEISEDAENVGRLTIHPDGSLSKRSGFLLEGI